MIKTPPDINGFGDIDSGFDFLVDFSPNEIRASTPKLEDSTSFDNGAHISGGVTLKNAFVVLRIDNVPWVCVSHPFGVWSAVANHSYRTSLRRKLLLGCNSQLNVSMSYLTVKGRLKVMLMLKLRIKKLLVLFYVEKLSAQTVKRGNAEVSLAEDVAPGVLQSPVAVRENLWPL